MHPWVTLSWVCLKVHIWKIKVYIMLRWRHVIQVQIQKKFSPWRNIHHWLESDCMTCIWASLPTVMTYFPTGIHKVCFGVGSVVRSWVTIFPEWQEYDNCIRLLVDNLVRNTTWYNLVVQNELKFHDIFLCILNGQISGSLMLLIDV